MTYKFIKERQEHHFSVDPRVALETDADTFDELIEDFKYFMGAAGWPQADTLNIGDVEDSAPFKPEEYEGDPKDSAFKAAWRPIEELTEEYKDGRWIVFVSTTGCEWVCRFKHNDWRDISRGIRYPDLAEDGWFIELPPLPEATHP